MFLKIFTEVNFITALRKTSLLTKYQCNKLLPPATEVCFVILQFLKLLKFYPGKLAVGKKIREQEYASSKG